MDRPVLGCKPYFVAIPERINELAEAIASYADCKTGIVEMWAREIVYLSKVLRELDIEEPKDAWSIGTASEPCPDP